MDLNATLEAIFAAVEAIKREQEGHTSEFDLEGAKDFLYRLSENLESLDSWMRAGAFMPDRWER